MMSVTLLYDSFSALQRAENSSLSPICVITPERASFSALQRAENSSTQDTDRYRAYCAAVSVLFSEPKIPQCKGSTPARCPKVSVLFSEPKIPQSMHVQKPNTHR